MSVSILIIDIQTRFSSRNVPHHSYNRHSDTISLSAMSVSILMIDIQDQISSPNVRQPNNQFFRELLIECPLSNSFFLKITFQISRNPFFTCDYFTPIMNDIRCYFFFGEKSREFFDTS